ncbi:hypothetical protein PHI80_43 [Enterobacteria phage phi80]|uniref:hypothetical protein n=1 Tax=Enterobacteria phage phi80 TaxID=10713 RepID=UPI0002CD06D0|nr:hypothetical protein ABF05_gp42 [Enterobacteria phage phi80]AFV29179.1 hypothetical protein PHI80_43 [Enterobacteria phage phi80]
MQCHHAGRDALANERGGAVVVDHAFTSTCSRRPASFICQRFIVSFSRGLDTDVSCHSLSLSFLAVYCLPLWVTVISHHLE